MPFRYLRNLESATRHQLARSQGIYDMVVAVTRKSDVHMERPNRKTEIMSYYRKLTTIIQ